MLKRMAGFAVIVLGIACAGSAFAEGPIGDQLKGNAPVKVYLGNFENASGQTAVTPEGYKKYVEQCLLARKSLKFQMVNSPAESQIQINGVIKKYQYLEKAQLKMIPNLPLQAIDVVQTATGNFVEMEAEFTVTDTKTNKVLWKDLIAQYIKKPMKSDESLGLISDKVIRSFVTKCFGKPK